MGGDRSESVAARRGRNFTEEQKKLRRGLKIYRRLKGERRIFRGAVLNLRRADHVGCYGVPTSRENHLFRVRVTDNRRFTAEQPRGAPLRSTKFVANRPVGKGRLELRAAPRVPRNF